MTEEQQMALAIQMSMAGNMEEEEEEEVGMDTAPNAQVCRLRGGKFRVTNIQVWLLQHLRYTIMTNL